MKVTNYKKEKSIPNPHKVEVQKLYDTKHAVINHIILKPGERLLPHITPVDAIFYILAGNPTVVIGDDEQECQKDDIVESPKKIKHYIKNDSKESARILVIKVPRQKDKTRLL